MPWLRKVQLCTLLALAGCQVAARNRAGSCEPFAPTITAGNSEARQIHDGCKQAEMPIPASIPSKVTIPASFTETEEVPSPTPPTAGANKQQDVLTLPQLIDEVEARNPSLQAMAAAWRAAAARYPQAISLEDPMFMAMAAPASFASEDVESAYALQLNQKFPWFGKRAARGNQATAEASAAYNDLEDSRLQLREVVQAAFYDYYLARRNLELNHENVVVVERFRSTAQAKYRTNQVTQQDELQATVDLADLERESIELQRADRIAAARINTLLRVDPYAALPPPPVKLDMPKSQIDERAVQMLAESQRPDLAALAAKVRAEEAAVTLACKEYYPDIDVFGRYDTFWQPADTQSDLRPQVGATINLPLYRSRLNAAVTEAVCRLNQRRAEYEQRRVDIQLEVATAAAKVDESRRALEVYDRKLIPASDLNVSAAGANYDVGKIGFLELAAAQRQSIDLRRKQEEALATYHARLAQLQRAVGGDLPVDTAFPK
jgi:cobalt-zinc-cadmium efflux system outer membrane protein